MNLREVINENTVAVDVKAQSKEEAFEYTCDLFLRDGDITSKEEFKQDLYIREPRGKTGIRDGIATSHGKSLAVKRNCISAFKLERPIQWEMPDGRPAQMFIIFIINQRDKDDYFLRLMVSVAKKLAQEGTCGKLTGSSTKEDILEAFYQKVTIPLRTRRRQGINITGAMACTVGVTHTYAVKEKLGQAARKLGYICRIETQGSTGIEEQLTPREIGVIGAIILAIDVKISGENRLKGKPVVRMSTEKVIKNTGTLLQSIEEVLIKKKDGGN